jgi:chemotaxis methyl-accepting protein methylase
MAQVAKPRIMKHLTPIQLKEQAERPTALKSLEQALADEFGWAANAINQAIIRASIDEKAQRLGLSPEDYCQHAVGSQSELLALVEATAIGETAFFREPQQYAFLRQIVFPQLLHGRPADQPLRLWSAACATGEEAYSLAIIANQVQSQNPSATVEILATDVRNCALLEASRSRYPASALTALDDATRAQFFERIGEVEAEGEMNFMLTSAARRLVAFRRLNLFDHMYWRGVNNRFDFIVCANVLSMLHGMAARGLVSNFAQALRPGGYLMVAPAEAGLVHSNKLTPRAEEPSFFRKNDGPKKIRA